MDKADTQAALEALGRIVRAIIKLDIEAIVADDLAYIRAALTAPAEPVAVIDHCSGNLGGEVINVAVRPCEGGFKKLMMRGAKLYVSPPSDAARIEELEGRIASAKNTLEHMLRDRNCEYFNREENGKLVEVRGETLFIRLNEFRRVLGEIQGEARQVQAVLRGDA